MKAKVEGNQWTQPRGLSLLGVSNRSPSPQVPCPTVNTRVPIHHDAGKTKQQNLLLQLHEGHTRGGGGNKVCNYFRQPPFIIQYLRTARGRLGLGGPLREGGPAVAAAKPAPPSLLTST